MGVKLAIGICSNRHCHPQFGDNMLALGTYLAVNGIKGVNLVNSQVLRELNASELCAARHDILINAIKGGFTHLLWIDDDSGFPRDMLDHLFAHGVDVVGVNTAKKNSKGGIYTSLDMNGQQLQSMGRTTLVEASAVGMGILLMNLAVMKNIQAPYFEILWDNQLQTHQSETRYFTRKLRQHGVKLWVDQALSQRIGHWGDNNFDYNHYRSLGIFS